MGGLGRRDEEVEAAPTPSRLSFFFAFFAGNSFFFAFGLGETKGGRRFSDIPAEAGIWLGPR
jgi:hypothetical protein